MTIKTCKSQIRTLRSDNPNFRIKDGIIESPRAGFEFHKSCPEQYKIIILDCISNGWLKPVAYVNEREMLFMGLTK